MILRAPGPDPITILPVPPSAAVESWYERELLHGVDQMNADALTQLQHVYKNAPQPILPMTFPWGEMKTVLDHLEEKWERTFNYSADEIALKFVRMNLEHHDLAFAHSLTKAGIAIPRAVHEFPDEEITLDGDIEGHAFHGNQWSGGQSGSHEGSTRGRGELPGQHFREGSKFPTTVTGVHYTGQAELKALDPGKYGTGNPGREYQRIMQMEPGPARDELMQRTYLYVAPKGETPKPEHILRDKSNAYEAKLTNVYDLEKDPEHLRESATNANALERSIIDHHYDGYMAPSPGAHGSVVLLGTPKIAVRPHYYTPAAAHDGDTPGHEFRGNQWTGGLGGQELSTRVPSTIKDKMRVADDPEHDRNLSDYASLKVALASKGGDKLAEKIAEKLRETPGLITDPRDTPHQVMEKYIQHGVDNLLFLHDSMPKEERDRAKLWYDGARQIAEKFAERHSISVPQAAAMMAVLSPQKDWFQNVSLAERVMDIMHEHQDTKWNACMTAWAHDKNGYKGEVAKANMHDLMHGNKDGGPLKLKDCKSEVQKAMWVRAYDETHNSKNYKELTPEGKSLGNAKLKGDEEDEKGEAVGKAGADGKIAWPSMNGIGKAIRVYEQGDIKTVSGALGDMHKVRNFYNNIVAPNSENHHVTIDTHAVAAIQLMPYGGSAKEVALNFGSSLKDAGSGLSGTYPLNHEVYVRAAAARGILPREMQSITWERVRGLFKPEFKRGDENQKDTKDAKGKVVPGREGNHTVRNAWADVKSGKATEGEARDRIEKAAGGFSPTPWSGRVGAGEIGAPTYEKVVVGDELHGGRDPRAYTGVGAGDAAPSTPARVQGSRRLIAMDKSSAYWSDFKLKFDLTPRLKETIKANLKENIDLISTKRIKDGPAIPRKNFARLRDIARESIVRGRDLVGFTKSLEDGFGITRRRASLIARDQNNKMTALFHRTRQLDCGITQAMWAHTAASLKPREEHEEFDRMVYSVDEGHDFDDGFGPVIPGEAINCGCLSMSIIPGYEE